MSGTGFREKEDMKVNRVSLAIVKMTTVNKRHRLDRHLGRHNQHFSGINWMSEISKEKWRFMNLSD